MHFILVLILHKKFVTIHIKNLLLGLRQDFQKEATFRQLLKKFYSKRS